MWGSVRAASSRLAVADQRHILPVRLSRDSCSFQFGRTSILFPLPHLAHTTRQRNQGTSVSAG